MERAHGQGGRALILASSSPRRRALLRDAGYRFRVVKPVVSERAPRGVSVAAAARAIARRKARAVAAGVRRPSVVLAADTLVAVGRAQLGKPRDARHARATLRRLSGTTHAVATGVCVVVAPEGRERSFAVTTRVTMRRWTDAELDAYVRSGEWKGKAGAYAIQETADQFVTRVRGSWTNVVGLPMERVTRCLAALGVRPHLVAQFARMRTRRR